MTNIHKTSENVFQYYIDEPALDDNGNNNNHNNTTMSFEFEANTICQTYITGTKDIEILVPSKQQSNFCRVVEMSLMNCEFTVH